MRAWLFGLNNSWLILCCSILENILKAKLYKIDIDLVYKISESKNILQGVEDYDLEILINNAERENLITFKEKNIAHKIRIHRNQAIHRLHTFSSKKTYDAILSTKSIIEKLLGKQMDSKQQ